MAEAFQGLIVQIQVGDVLASTEPPRVKFPCEKFDLPEEQRCWLSACRYLSREECFAMLIPGGDTFRRPFAVLRHICTELGLEPRRSMPDLSS